MIIIIIVLFSRFIFCACTSLQQQYKNFTILIYMGIKKTRSTADILLSRVESTDHVVDVFPQEDISTDTGGWDTLMEDDSNHYFDSHAATSASTGEKTLHRTPSKAQLTLFKKGKPKGRNYSSDNLKRTISTESIFDNSEPVDIDDVRSMSSENLTLLAVAHAAGVKTKFEAPDDEEIRTLQQAIQMIPPTSPLTQPHVPVVIDEPNQAATVGHKTLGLAAAGVGFSLALAAYIIAK